MLSSPSFSLHFLLVVSQGQDLSLQRRSWPCCIFIERTECLKKRSSIEGENFRLCIDFYMCCWVSLFDHRVPWLGFCLGHSISPTHAMTVTQCVMLGLVQAWVQLYTDIYAYLYHQRHLIWKVNCENGAAMSPLLVWNVELTHSAFIYMQYGNHLHISEISSIKLLTGFEPSFSGEEHGLWMDHGCVSQNIAWVLGAIPPTFRRVAIRPSPCERMLALQSSYIWCVLVLLKHLKLNALSASDTILGFPSSHPWQQTGRVGQLMTAADA